ncbi:MAG: ribonuclease HII [Halanaeroarchaeum sp.]
MRFGVDEAGKGPVLGSMFAAAVLAEPAALPAAVADSKRLAPDRREAIDDALRASDEIAVGVAEVTPAEIDDPETDMNTLTVAAQARAIAAIPAAGRAGLLDAGDVDAARFARRVRERVDADVELEAAHGADAADPLVAAASVVAKVARDDHVEALADAYDADVGSGYPGDPTTIAFLEEYLDRHGSLPEDARTTWSTSERLVARAEQSGLEEFSASR